MKELAIGTPAPKFTLPDEHGTPVALSHFIGKKNVLLFFYPGDMTPGCTMQLCAVRDEWPKFVKSHTVVFGINHADAESHLAFRKKHHLPFPLLTDKGKRVSTAYGAIRMISTSTRLSAGKLKLINRSVIGIDTQGHIAYIKRGMPKNADILKALSHFHSSITKH